MPNPQVTFPAYFTSATAVAFTNPDSSAQLVSAVTPLPVTIAAASGTQAISAAALPLPAGAATAANQTTSNTTLATISGQLPSTLGIKAATASMSFAPASDAVFPVRVQDGAGTAVTSSTIAGKQRLDVTLAAGATPGFAAPTIADQVGGVDGGGILRAFSVDTSGRVILAAGTNKIGGVTVADGDLNTLGARADAAAVNTTSSQSAISLLKYLINATLAPLAAGSNLIGQVQPSYFAPASWAAPSTAQDMRAYSSVTVVVTTAPSVAYTPQWSPDGTFWTPVAGIDLMLNTQTSIGATFSGAIRFPGGGYIRLNGGTGGAFQIAGGN